MFLIPCLANLFAAIGLFIPFVYVVDRSVALGVKPEMAAFLISVIGQSLSFSLSVSVCLSVCLLICLLQALSIPIVSRRGCLYERLYVYVRIFEAKYLGNGN